MGSNPTGCTKTVSGVSGLHISLKNLRTQFDSAGTDHLVNDRLVYLSLNLQLKGSKNVQSVF